MATSILPPQGHSHFDQGTQFYPQTAYHDFNRRSTPADDLAVPLTTTEQNTVVPNSHSQYTLSNAQRENMSLATSQPWASQIGGRRHSSKSPNVTERTPIRHHRGHSSRARSTSGSEALLAYATEQTLQQQQQQQSSMATPPLIQQNSPMSSPPMFPSQAFSSISPAAPFMQQQQQVYYDNSTSAFPDLQSQHVSHAMSDYYPLSRNDVHTSPLSASNLSAHEALYLQQAVQPRSQALPSLSAQPPNFPPISRPLESTPGNVEVSSSRNKPQCWDHGCNGRQFSTFSNLLRHQREKSGTAAKARCPHCGTEFTRTTARNGHMYGGKCKGLPDASKRSSISESVEPSGE